MSQADLPRATTPEPSLKIREGVARCVTAMGGRVHTNAVHADRVRYPTEDRAPKKIELAECGHRGTLVDMPYQTRGPGGVVQNRTARLCTVCDALPRTPRVLSAARSFSK